MPQRFPMSWIILSLLFSVCMFISLFHIFLFSYKIKQILYITKIP